MGGGKGGGGRGGKVVVNVILIVRVLLKEGYLQNLDWDSRGTGKQCRPRSDAAERGV